MRHSIFLLPFLASLSGSTAVASRKLYEQKVDLKNGAVLSVNITSPEVNTSFLTEEPVHIKGTASVGLGVPDVSYIYIIDTSTSTADQDGECGTVLNCTQEFFHSLHEDVIAHGSAEQAAVINFDDTATISTGFQHPRESLIATAIESGYSGGWTNCTDALLKAAALVKGPSNKAGTTVVVFSGDGVCMTAWDEEDDDQTTEAVRAAAAVLGNTGAIVHTVAVGDEVNCTQSPGYPNDFLDIPQNGGRCISVRDPHELPDFTDEIIGTKLLSIELQVDDDVNKRKDIPSSNLSVALPQDGAVAVDFDTIVSGLEPGLHKACVRVTGNDTIGGRKQLEDCHHFLVVVEEIPSTTTTTGAHRPEGWQVFVAIFVITCAGAVFVLLTKYLGNRYDTTADPTADLGLEEEFPHKQQGGGDDHGFDPTGNSVV